jgi:hypothetical protein
LGQGREKARAYLEENPAVVEELKAKVQAAGAATAVAAVAGGAMVEPNGDAAGSDDGPSDSE